MMISSRIILLALVAVTGILAQHRRVRNCDPVDPPPRDPSCKWEGIRDPETNCIVDYDCVPTDDVPKADVICASSPSGCVVAYDCVRKEAEARLIPATGRPDCPQVTRPVAHPECIGYDVFKDQIGCIYEFRCIRKEAIYEPVTSKPLPRRRRPPPRDPLPPGHIETPPPPEPPKPHPRPAFQRPNPNPQPQPNAPPKASEAPQRPPVAPVVPPQPALPVEPPKSDPQPAPLRVPESRPKPGTNPPFSASRLPQRPQRPDPRAPRPNFVPQPAQEKVDEQKEGREVANKLTERTRCRNIERPRPDSNCLGFRQFKDSNGCIERYDCIPLGNRRRNCPRVHRPSFNPSCVGYDVRKDPNGCIIAYFCIPVGSAWKPREGNREIPPNARPAVICDKIEEPEPTPECQFYHPVRNSDGCIIDFDCIPGDLWIPEPPKPAPSGSGENPPGQGGDVSGLSLPETPISPPSKVSASCKNLELPEPIPGCAFYLPVKNLAGCTVRFDCVPEDPDFGTVVDLFDEDFEKVPDDADADIDLSSAFPPKIFEDLSKDLSVIPGPSRRSPPCKELAEPDPTPGCAFFHAVRDDKGCIVRFDCVPGEHDFSSWVRPRDKNEKSLGEPTTEVSLTTSTELPSPTTEWFLETERSEQGETKHRSLSLSRAPPPSDKNILEAGPPGVKPRSFANCKYPDYPDPIPGCAYYRSVQDSTGCTVRYDCVYREPGADHLSTPSDEYDYEISTTPAPIETTSILFDEYEDDSGPDTQRVPCPKIDYPPFSPSCLGYRPIKDTHNCTVDFFCVPGNPASVPLRELTTKPEDPEPPKVESAEPVAIIQSAEPALPDEPIESDKPVVPVDSVEPVKPVESIDSVSSSAELEPCIFKHEPEDQPDCLRFEPVYKDDGCILDYKCIERVAKPEPCIPKLKPVKQPECEDYEPVQRSDGCIVEWECVPKAPVITKSAESLESKEGCNPPVKPRANNVCIDWKPVEDENGCVTRHECVSDSECKGELAPPNSNFCKRYVPWRDQLGCVRRWFCVPITFPVQPEIRRSASTKCSDIGKPDPNRECEDWEPIFDQATGCIRTFGCIARPVPDCPPTEIPEPDEQCIEWKPIEDERFCIKEYKCILREAPVACEQLDPPASTDCSEWKAIRNHQGCVESFECLQSVAGEREEKEVIEEENPNCLIGDPPSPDVDCRDWKAVHEKGCVVNYECVPAIVPAGSIKDVQKQQNECAVIDPPQGDCDDWRTLTNVRGCIVAYECHDNVEDFPSDQLEDSTSSITTQPEIDNSISPGCVPLPPPPEGLYPECVTFKPITDATDCIVDYQCLINLENQQNNVAPVRVVTVEETPRECKPPPRPQPTPQCVDFRPITNADGCVFNFECLASSDAQAKLIDPLQFTPTRHGEAWRQPQSHAVDQGHSAHWQGARPQQIQPQWQPQPAAQQWQQPQHPDWQAPQPQPAHVQPEWQPQPQPQPQPAQVWEPAPQPQQPEARPVIPAWEAQQNQAAWEARNARPSQFQPGPRADGQAPACASVHVPPTNYRCAGWSPQYDQETGCIDHYECIPAPPVPHIPPTRPCPHVPKPRAHELCRWTARIEPRTGCKSYYECRPVNTPGSFCPVVPYPRPVSRCEWTPVFNRDTGCVITYRCSLIPDCPTRLGSVPAARDGCIWTVATDSKGCDSEYKCVDHAGNNDAGISYTRTSGEALIKEVPPCDPRDPHVCTGWREPMEWGCCARYRDFPRSYFRWHNRGCYCEPNRRRCVIERTVPGESNHEANDQWSYCVPKETFDCYNKFFQKGALCDN